MKKIYIQPKLNVVKIAVTQMICTSAELDPNKSIDSASDFGSRSNNGLWDDDDE